MVVASQETSSDICHELCLPPSHNWITIRMLRLRNTNRLLIRRIWKHKLDCNLPSVSMVEDILIIRFVPAVHTDAYTSFSGRIWLLLNPLWTLPVPWKMRSHRNMGPWINSKPRSMVHSQESKEVDGDGSLRKMVNWLLLLHPYTVPIHSELSIESRSCDGWKGLTWCRCLGTCILPSSIFVFWILANCSIKMLRPTTSRLFGLWWTGKLSVGDSRIKCVFPTETVHRITLEFSRWTAYPDLSFHLQYSSSEDHRRYRSRAQEWYGIR